MPAAATCDLSTILISNSNKAAGTGNGTHGGTVAVTWSASVTLRSRMRSRAACAPVCCRRERPEYPRCSRQWFGVLDVPCSDDGYSGNGDAVCTTGAFVFAGCTGG